jgi:type IV secretion system protein VirB10
MALFARALSAVRSTAQPVVEGERGAPLIASGMSLQSRISNLLAMGLMLAVGVAFLAWYYSHAAARPARARLSAQASLANRAQAEMALPPLGPIALPANPVTMVDPTDSVDAAVRTIGEAPSPSSVSAPALEPLSVAASARRPSALERRLSGAAFASASTSTAGSGVGVADSGTAAFLPAPVLMSATAAPSSGVITGSAPDTLGPLLKSGVTAAVHARVLPTQRLLLPIGAFIDCTLETAIDSTLPGLATCVTATDTFSADGTVVLLERGTKLIGETRGQVQQGAARVFVLWTEARTPTGVVVPLDSPGADELGRSGLAGEVDRHFWQRFGAAILISTIDGAMQAAVQSASRGNGTVIYNPSGAQDVMSEVLKSTVNIAPTVRKNNGDRIQVLVARDVDFSNVYELRHAAGNP